MHIIAMYLKHWVYTRPYTHAHTNKNTYTHDAHYSNALLSQESGEAEPNYVYNDAE